MKHLAIITLSFLFHWHPCNAGVTDEFEELRGKWIDAFNSQSNDIKFFYRDDAAVFTEGHFLFGKDLITEHFSKSTASIRSAQVTNTYKNYRNRYFETGIYITDDPQEKPIHFVTIWFLSSGDSDQPRWLRELDVLYQQAGEHNDSESLTAARKQWNKLATRRSALRMIEALYTEDAVYIHKRKVYNGRPSIISEYSTYIDAGYAVRLKLKHSQRVQPDITIDTGKYNAGADFTGYYVQVWKQQPDKSWRVIFEAD